MVQRIKQISSLLLLGIITTLSFVGCGGGVAQNPAHPSSSDNNVEVAVIGIERTKTYPEEFKRESSWGSTTYYPAPTGYEYAVIRVSVWNVYREEISILADFDYVNEHTVLVDEYSNIYKMSSIQATYPIRGGSQILYLCAVRENSGFLKFTFAYCLKKAYSQDEPEKYSLDISFF